MPYNYKGFTLPVHYDKNWHSYVDPFFRTLIDKDENHNNSIAELYTLIDNTQSIYTVELYDEVDDSIYTLRVFNDSYVVYKVTYTEPTYITYIATLELNPLYSNKIDMWTDRYTLIYISLQ